MRNISSKRLLLIILLLILFVTAAIMYYVMQQPTNQQTPKVSIIVPSPSHAAPLPTYSNFFEVSDNNLPSTPDGWNTGENPTYNIKFPQDWVPITDEVNGGGIRVFLHPKSADNRYFPRIDIENLPGNTSALTDDKMKQLKEFSNSASQKKITFRGIPAVQMSETLPMSDTKGNQLHKTYLFFTTKTNSFTITYAYFADEHAQENQYTILQILNSLSLK